MATERVLAEVAAERARQEERKAAGRFKHTCADPEMNDYERYAVLGEEAGEAVDEHMALKLSSLMGKVAREILTGGERRLARDTVGTVDALRGELLQVAAVAVAWVEALPEPEQCPLCGSPDPAASFGVANAHGVKEVNFNAATCAHPFHAPTDNQAQDRYTVDRVSEETVVPTEIADAIRDTVAECQREPATPFLAALLDRLRPGSRLVDPPAPADGEEGGSEPLKPGEFSCSDVEDRYVADYIAEQGRKLDALTSEGAARTICFEVSGLSPEDSEDVGDVLRALQRIVGTDVQEGGREPEGGARFSGGGARFCGCGERLTGSGAVHLANCPLVQKREPGVQDG